MNWKQVDNKLTKSFRFENQEKLAQFFLKVALISDEMNHHADVKIYNCSEIEFSIYTHTSLSITNLDEQLTNKIDVCFLKL
jgi:4a-hydroxytetrahydrobiopterin dehydratase